MYILGNEEAVGLQFAMYFTVIVIGTRRGLINLNKITINLFLEATAPGVSGLQR